MNYSRSFNHLFTITARFFTSAPVFLALTIAVPLSAQVASDDGDGGAARRASASAADAPASRQKAVTVMVEMNAAPAAVQYAASYKDALAQADAARIYALKHPNLKSSKAVLANKSRVEITSAAANKVQTNVQQLDSAQRSLLPTLTGAQIGGKVLFRVQRAYNGIALTVNPAKISEIQRLPGVKAVHPMHPKTRTVAFSDIDFTGTRSVWSKAPFGIHGENIKVADIDTGLDYIHTNFGGPGTAGYALVPDHTVAPNAFFPTPKIPNGYDFAGDDYNANEDPGTGHDPAPDPDPFDCNGHGTATASLIGGYGVTNAGFTYSGNYNASDPVMTALTISPGYAPSSKIFPLRVFGCEGSTNLTTLAIEWAMDPNGDGNFVDRVDAINMSLGSQDGSPEDDSAVASTNAALAGILVVCSAGNSGDSFYVTGSPGVNTGGLSVAATYSDQNGFISDSAVTGNAPPAIAGTKYFSIFGSASSHSPVTGNVVYAVPPNAATALTNNASLAGNIMFVNRGGTTFADMMSKATTAGAIGVIVNNFNNPTSPPIVMSTAGQSATLTDVMIARADRNAIVTAAGGDPTQANGYNAGLATGFNPTTGVPTTPVNVSIATDPLTTHIFATFPPGTSAQAGAPDTVPSYTSRGPRMPDSVIKPDLAAPAEVTGVAATGTGNGFQNFNGTSSAAPHVTGMMALLKQLHPTWSVQELNALACDTATHNLATTVGGSTLLDVGRVGAGRIDVTKAGNANVVAYNGTDPLLIGVSFGAVDVPVDGSRALTKNVKLANKGTSDVTYNITYEDTAPTVGSSYTLPASVTVLAGSTNTFPVTYNATGSALRHDKDASVATSQATSFGTFSRQYLTEKTGYAVLTPTGGPEPVIRVALYAAPRPTSAMHATVTGVVPAAPSGSFTLNLSGTPINTGASFPNDIVSYVKGFELQYASPLANSPSAPTDPNKLRYVGITSDWANRTTSDRDNFLPVVTWAIEGFGDAALPTAFGSDKEIFIDLDFDSVYDLVAFATSLPNSTSHTNVFWTELVDLTGVIDPLNPGTGYFWDYPVNARAAGASSRDTNSFNSSAITMPIDGIVGTGFPDFLYQVVTFDRNGNEVDETPVLYYSAAAAGLDATPAATLDPFFLNDLPTTSITVNYNGANFQNNGSLGVLLMHRHNGPGNRSDVVAFRSPTITGFSPTHAKVGQNVTITGSNFGPGTIVEFFDGTPGNGGAVATTTPITANTLIATVPAGAVSGPIKVSNAAGSSQKGGFTVDP